MFKDGDDGGDEEDEESHETLKAAEAAAVAAAIPDAIPAADPDAPKLPPWASTVDLMRPQDATNEGRNDPPEETVTPLIQRTVNYANTLSPEPQTVSEEGEVVLVATPTVAHGGQTGLAADVPETALVSIASRSAGEDSTFHLPPSSAAYLVRICPLYCCLLHWL